MSQETKKPSIARSAAVMGVATFFSRIAGLVREQTFAYLFGAGIWTDAFNVAFRIPNLLRDLFAEGAMSAAFVPTFNGILEKDGQQKAFRLTNLTFCAILVVVGMLTLVGIIASPLLVSTLAPEFTSNPEKFEVTVTMTRIMFPFLLAVSWAAISMGILNSLGEFFIPAIAPVFLNLSMILAGWLICPFAKEFDMPAITGMAIGAMLGGLLQFAVQLPALFRYGYRFRWQLNFKDPGIQRIIKLIIPGTVGLAATQINIAISTILATSQGEGAVSWLGYAFRVMQLPLGLFGVAVAQATLPVISRQIAADRGWRSRRHGADAGRLDQAFFIYQPLRLLCYHGSGRAGGQNHLSARALHRCRHNRNRHCSAGLCGRAVVLLADQNSRPGILHARRNESAGHGQHYRCGRQYRSQPGSCSPVRLLGPGSQHRHRCHVQRRHSLFYAGKAHRQFQSLLSDAGNGPNFCCHCRFRHCVGTGLPLRIAASGRKYQYAASRRLF